ncbi:hypothetical protein [Paraburkholderia sp. Ac-20342]|nr:hypothetical protein [Paraburkholderia sp. Ac-20342]
MNPTVKLILEGYGVLAFVLLIVVIPMCKSAARGDKQLRGE